MKLADTYSGLDCERCGKRLSKAQLYEADTTTTGENWCKECLQQEELKRIERYRQNEAS